MGMGMDKAWHGHGHGHGGRGGLEARVRDGWMAGWLYAHHITTCTQLVVRTPCKRKNRSGLRGGGGGVGGGAQGRLAGWQAGQHDNTEGRPAGRSWFMALLATPTPLQPYGVRWNVHGRPRAERGYKPYAGVGVSTARWTRSSRGRGLGEVINACIVTHVARERVEAQELEFGCGKKRAVPRRARPCLTVGSQAKVSHSTGSHAMGIGGRGGSNPEGGTSVRVVHAELYPDAWVGMGWDGMHS